MPITIELRFDGLEATHHRIDMRRLGQSLVGLDAVLTLGLTAIAEQRLPRFREKPALAILVSAPEARCVTLTGIITAAVGALPYINAILSDQGSEIAWNMISAVVKTFGGKRAQVDDHVDKLLDLTKEFIKDRQGERDLILAIINRSEPSVRNLISPVGTSCEILRLSSPSGSTTEIDVPMADAVRSKHPLEVGDMTKMRVKVDGLIMHNRTLKLIIDGQPGFVTADVRDPAFDETPNIYTRAISGLLDVEAKPTYRDGTLVKLYVLDASEVSGVL